MAESQDVNALKRRGRRRLVGAIALVLAAVIVLPWIFDPSPRQAPPVSVRIPNEDDSPFLSKVAPKPPPPLPAEQAPKPGAPAAPAQEAKPAAKPVPPKPAPPPLNERARAEAALANAQFFVPVGAYADAGNVTAKLKAAKLPYYTEPVATAKGPVTRVRAGPFASRSAAEKAHQQLRALGFSPGSVGSRP
jgi:DedD protein